MTTFKEIRGKLIRTLDTDPTPATNYEGQIWYNKTIGVLKSAALADVGGTWAATNPVVSAQKNYSAAGTQTASYIASGSTPANVTITTTQEYDGTSWTVVNPVLTTYSNRANSGTGTQTAGLMCGGYGGAPALPRSVTEEYDGTSWTSGGNLNTARWRASTGGTQTAGIFNGGHQTISTPPFNTTATEEYNGSAWTNVTGSTLARRYQAGFGTTQTAFAVVGGYKNPESTAANDVEEYNGSTWTAGTNYPTTIHSQQGFGSLTAGVICGGTEPGTTQTLTKSYDGSTWTAQGAMAVGRQGASATGNSSAGIIGGRDTTDSEEYTGPFQEVQTKTLTTS